MAKTLKTIIFLTNAYPYLPGEQFIEDEIGYWASQSLIRTILVPLTASGTPRTTPKGIEIDFTLAQTNTYRKKIKSLFSAITSRLFWKEAEFIYATKGLNFECYLEALRAVAHVFRIRKALINIHKKHKTIDIAYCYWNSLQCYAAVLLKQHKLIKKVFSRAHGFDLYEERQANQYMPLKRQFTTEMDCIFSISNSGKSYLETTYSIPSKKILVSRLGVPVPVTMAQHSELKNLSIVSVSFCTKIKRVDKIIDAIAESAAILREKKNITWTHIGAGPLLEELKTQAYKKLTPLGIKWDMPGSKPNAEVKQYFEINRVDIFINASESEGVPVSIMEAMSYGVPTIAPDVGGIAELVSNEYGQLLSEMPSVSEIATAIVSMSTRCKEPECRLRAKQKIAKDYNAKSNYQSLIKLINN